MSAGTLCPPPMLPLKDGSRLWDRGTGDKASCIFCRGPSWVSEPDFRKGVFKYYKFKFVMCDRGLFCLFESRSPSTDVFRVQTPYGKVLSKGRCGVPKSLHLH